MDDRNIFLEALNHPKPEERAAYLSEACGNDAELRQRVELLLAAHEDAGSFLEKTPDELLATLGQQSEIDLDSWKELLTPSGNEDSLGMLGHYEILELIGRGGMGVVFSARDPQLNRVVAIKVLAPELAANAVSVQRFLREAQAAAAVSHDHVVTIHAIDKQARPPLIVMERIAGQSLQEKIDKEGSLDVKSILRIGMQTASGLAAAHKQGLIHRDIKPSNILLENGIERVKLTDFGLARAVDDIGMTRTGQITGTPQYMSPEQAQGHAIDHRTDLFSLGCVLYAMCTGRAAFRAESAVAVMHRVVHEAPRPIREMNEDVPVWLCRIVEKLMEKEPDRRFSSASEVEDLLGRHLAHLQQPESVPLPELMQNPTPQSVPQIESEPTFVTRTFLGVGLTCLAYTIFVVLVHDYYWLTSWGKAVIVPVLMSAFLSFPVGLLAMNAYWDFPRRKRYWWVFAAAVAAVIPWNPILLLALPWTLLVLSKLRRPEMRQAFGFADTSVHSPSASSDSQSGPRSLTVGHALVNAFTVRRFLAVCFLVILALSLKAAHEVFEHANDFAPDHPPQGQLVVNAGYEDVTVRYKGSAYSATSYHAHERSLAPGEYTIIASRSLGDGSYAFHVENCTVRQGETTTIDLEQELASPGIHDFDSIQPLLADSPKIATLHITVDDPDVRLTINGVDWDIAGKGPQTVPLQPGGYAFLGMHGSEKAFEQAIALKAGEERSLTLESNWGSGAESTESNSNTQGELLSTIRLWNRWKQRGEMSPILAIDENKDGTWMASGHRSGFLYLWDLYYLGESLYGFRATNQNSRTYDIEFSPDGRSIAWVEFNGQLRLRKTAAHQVTTSDKFDQVNDAFRSLAWTPDSQTILVGGRGKLYVWNIDQHEGPVATVDVPGNALVLDIAYSPRDNEFATALADGNIILWTFEQSTPTLKTILREAGGKPAHSGEANAITYSPTEPLLVSCGADGDVKGWASGDSERPLWTQNYVNEKALLSVQISHNGKMCAAVGEDRQLHLFDIHTQKSLIEGPLEGTEIHDAEITAVRFSWSDDILTTASTDGFIKKWYYQGAAKTAENSVDWILLLSEAASIPLNEWNTLSGDIKGPDTIAVRGEPLSLVLLNLNPFEAAKANEKVRQDFWYLTETIPKPNEIGDAISISREQGYVSFLQPEYITNVGADESGGSVVGFAGFTVSKLYSGRVGFKAGRINGELKITEFTLPNYGITLQLNEQQQWQRQNSPLTP